MAAPHEVLYPGPINPRGLTDYPESAVTGSAIVALNVEFSRGYLEPRKGSIVLNHTAMNVAGQKSWVRLVALIENRLGGSPLLLVASIVQDGVLSGLWEVSLFALGQATALHSEYVGPALPKNPSIVSYSGKYLIFLPCIVASGAYTYTYEVDTAGIRQWDCSNKNRPPLGGGDPAPYYDWTYPSGQEVYPRFGWIHAERLFLSGFTVEDEAATIRFTAEADIHGLPGPGSNQFIVGDGTEPVTGGASFSTTDGSSSYDMLVFTKSSISQVDFTYAAQKQRVLTKHTGCVAFNTICYASNMLFFLAETGLMALDHSGTVTEISKGVHETLLERRGDFENACVMHYPEKHQVWLLLPGFREIFIFDLKAKEIAIYNWPETATVEALAPCSACMFPISGRSLPIVGFSSDSGQGFAALMEQENYTDYRGSVLGQRDFTAYWFSMPVPLLGRHQMRLFRYLRPTIMDTGSVVLRAFWRVDEQLDTGTIQHYTDITCLNPFLAFPRVGSVDPQTDASHVEDVDSTLPLSGGKWFRSSKISLGGRNKGAYIQVGFVSYTAANKPWGVRSFEIDSRVEGRR